MDSKRKFISLNSVKKLQQNPNRSDVFSNYIHFSPKTLQEKLVSDYNFQIAHGHENRPQIQPDYERSLFESTNKFNSRKIQFKLNENEMISSFTNQGYQKNCFKNCNNNIKGILKASNLSSLSASQNVQQKNVNTYFSEKKVQPTFLTMRGEKNENILKNDRLAEIKEKLRNSGRYVQESEIKKDPFANYVKGNLLIREQQNNFSRVNLDPQSRQIRKNPIQMDAFCNYFSLMNCQNNLINVVGAPSVRLKSNVQTQKDPSANNYTLKEKEYSKNIKIPLRTKELRKNSSDLTEKDLFSFNPKESLLKEKYMEHSNFTPRASENLSREITNSNPNPMKDSIKNLKNQGTLSCKIFLRNPQSKENTSEKREDNNICNESNFQNNKVNFISKSCLINQSEKIVLENNNGRSSVFEYDKNNSRSSSLPQKYKLTDVKKAIIFSNIPTFNSPFKPVTHSNSINCSNCNAKNNINLDQVKNFTNNAKNDKVDNNIINHNHQNIDINRKFERKRESFAQRPNQEDEPKNSSRITSPSSVISHQNFFKKIEMLGKTSNDQKSETYQARKDNHENAAKLMNDLMKKLSDYFNDEFEKLTKFNQFMYMTYIENKKKLRLSILEDLSKLTKFEQEVLLDYCKRLYSKSAKKINVKPENHSGIANILETYNSQTDLRQKIQQNNLSAKNKTPVKSPWDLREINKNSEKKVEMPSGLITEKYFQQESVAKLINNQEKKNSMGPNLKQQQFNSLKSISVESDFKKYIDGIRASLNSEKIKTSLNSNLNREIKSQNQINSSQIEEKPSDLHDQLKTSDYSTASDTCTHSSKLSASKYFNPSSKHRCSSSDESKTHYSKSEVRNKIELGNEAAKKVVTYSSLLKSIGEIGKPLNNPIYDSKISLDDKKSLTIEIVNNTSKKVQRKRDLSSTRLLNSQNLIENDNSKYAKSFANNQRKIKSSCFDEYDSLKNNSIEEFAKNFTEENKHTDKRLSQIEMKFLNLRRNIEMYSDTNRVFIH